MSNTGSTLSAYRPQVFDDDATLDEKLEAIREYCLSLREWRSEDYTELSRLRGRVRELEGKAGEK